MSGAVAARGQTLHDWLASRPFTLTLSSGFFGFFAHTGVVMALAEAGLRPARATGSSAGALVAGFLAAGMAPEAMRERILGVRKSDFWDPSPGLGLLRGRRFRALIARDLPTPTFDGCPLPLALSVYEPLRHRTRVLRTGDLAAAIHASCALPLLFQPVRIAGRILLDGGVLDRPGLAGAEAGTATLYHHLGSRSWWRRRNGAHTRIPVRDRLVTLSLGSLPRSGPDRLEVGPQALSLARERTLRLLEQPVSALMQGGEVTQAAGLNSK